MDENVSVQRRAPWWRWVAVAVLCLVVGAAAAWALLTVLKPVDDPLSSPSFTYVTVSTGQIGSSINLNTAAEWKAAAVGANQASGIVTSVLAAPGAQVTQGTALYTVGLRPVVVAEGDIPAFRSIASGTSGADVAQLQRMLIALGLYKGNPDGTAGVSTVSAINMWQKSQGLAQTGVVGVGDVIFVPQLPARISLDTKIIARGRAVTGGEDVVLGLPSEPAFTVSVTQTQATMLPTGTRVEIKSPNGSIWEAFAAERTTDPATQNVIVALVGKAGASICGDQCEQLPVTGQALLASKAITVEPLTGLVVPSAALVTDPDGTTALISAQGKSLRVRVVASAQGLSVIDGVPAATRVRIPASATQ